jgi:hypothetical protein
MTLSNEVIGNGLFAMAAALAAIAYQYWQFRRQLVKSQKEIIAAEKKKVIEALISYRFVMGERRNDPLPTMHFNAALSAIPVHFSDSKECIDGYRGIGDGFTPEKYYNLIIALMQDVPLGVAVIDKHLLENVPSVTPKTGT